MKKIENKKEKYMLISTIVISGLYGYITESLTYFSIMTVLILLSICLTLYMLDNITNTENIKKYTTILLILNILQINIINIIILIFLKDYLKTTIMQHAPPNKNIDVQKEMISKEAKKIDMLLKIGVFLVILSGIIFSTSNTGEIIDILKPFFILILSMIFYGLSYLFKTKIIIKKSEDTYYILSNIFLIFFAVALGYFKTFGEFLSFGGEGEKIVYSLILLLSSILTKNISKKYNIDFLTIISYLMIYSSIAITLFFFELDALMVIASLLVISLISQVIVAKENTYFHISRYTLVYLLTYILIQKIFVPCEIIEVLKTILCTGLLLSNLYLISNETNKKVHKHIFIYASSFFLLVTLMNISDLIIPESYLIDNITNILIYLAIISLIMHHIFVNNEEYKYVGFTLTSIYLTYIILLLVANSITYILFILSTILLIYSVSKIYKKENHILKILYFVFQIILIGLVISSGKEIIKDIFNITTTFNTTILLYLCIIAIISIFEDEFITKIKIDKILYYILITLISIQSLICLQQQANIFNIITIISLILYRIYVNKHIKNNDIINCLIIATTLIHFQYILLQFIPLITNYILILSLIIAAFILKKDKLSSVYCASLTYIPLISISKVINLSIEVEAILRTLPLLIIVMLISNNILSIQKKSKTILETTAIMLIMILWIFEINIIIGLYIGIISLLMIYLGTNYEKFNSLYISGIIILILNIIVQLHEYWEKIPWFVYTLIAGLGIIFYVTYKEFNKDKIKKVQDVKIEYHEEKEYNLRNNFIVLGLFFTYFIIYALFFMNMRYIENKHQEKQTIEQFNSLNLDKNKFYFSNQNHPILYILEGNTTNIQEILKKLKLNELHVCWIDENGMNIAKETNDEYRYYNKCLYDDYYFENDEIINKKYTQNNFEIEVKNEVLNYIDIWGNNYNNPYFYIEYNKYETPTIDFCINRYNINIYDINVIADYYEPTNIEETCFKASDDERITIVIRKKPIQNIIPSTPNDDIIYN